MDIETESLINEHPEYALQPWRIPNEARISIVCYRSENTAPVLSGDISELNNKYVFTWNGVFDIACLLAAGVDCSKIKWLDAMSAAKWCLRSQKTDSPSGKRTSWTLVDIAKDYLKNWRYYNEYINLKSDISDDEQYWRFRCSMDTTATLLLGLKFWRMMTEKQKKGFLIEQEALYPTASSWLTGYKYDFKQAASVAVKWREKMNECLEKLRCYVNSSLDLKKVIDSPKQLSELIYNKWKVPFEDSLQKKEAKTMQKSVGKEALTFLIERFGSDYPQLLLIKEYRELKSYYDKFISGPLKCREYLGSDILHHQLRLNSTYTGRCTVSSKL